jgi:hypothetical protein
MADRTTNAVCISAPYGIFRPSLNLIFATRTFSYRGFSFSQRQSNQLYFRCSNEIDQQKTKAHDKKIRTKKGGIMGTKEKLETLKQRKAKLEQEIAALQTRENAQARKEDTRLKVLIGAAMLTDSKIRPKTVDMIEEVLQRGIKEERDREFLKSKGWLKIGNPKNGQ